MAWWDLSQSPIIIQFITLLPLLQQALLVLPPACRQSGSHQDPTTLSTYDSLASPTNLWAPPSNNSTTDESPFSGHSPQVRIVSPLLFLASWTSPDYQATTSPSVLSTPQPLDLWVMTHWLACAFLNRSSLVLGFGTRQCMCLLGSEPWPLICVWGITEQPVPSQNQSSLKISRPFNFIVFSASLLRTTPSNISPTSVLGCLGPNTP